MPGVALVAAGWLGVGARPKMPGDDLPDFGPALVAILGIYALVLGVTALGGRVLWNRTLVRHRVRQAADQ